MTSRGKDLDKLAKDLQKLEEQSTSDQEAHAAAQKHYQAVTAGLSSNEEGQAATLNDQLMSKWRSPHGISPLTQFQRSWRIVLLLGSGFFDFLFVMLSGACISHEHLL